ncbi:MAG TPA: hypothetical protein VJI75_06635 [Candidatus Nanoarchaeia archaeon]|nr:hypothetical protein [Candidatus Nanoarchaeia archaeon]
MINRTPDRRSRSASDMSKKGYFFTIDVIIAMVIIVVGFTLIWVSFVSETQQRQPYFYAQDILDFLSTTTNQDLSVMPAVQELFFNGNITDLDRTALEQIGAFYKKRQTETSPEKKEALDTMILNYTATIVQNTVSSQYSYELYFKHELIYNQSGLSGRTQETSDVLVSAKKLVVIVIDHTGEENWAGQRIELSSPMLAEVRVWR